jgi:RNA recognition motif-containing protein
MRYYLGNLPYSASEDDIRSFFAPYALDSVKIITDRETGRPRGFAFIDMDDGIDSNHVIGKYDATDFGGRTVVVNVANEKPRGEKRGPRNEKPRGGYGDGGYRDHEEGRGERGQRRGR